MKIGSFCTTLALMLLTGIPLAQAQSAAATNLKSVALKTPAAAEPTSDDDDSVPDVLKSANFEYKCELNDFLTIYTNVDDNNHMALRWKNRLYRLTRVVTTTGANRFENKKLGLVWIGIPSKGMLLDSRRGQQLANECKTAGQ